MVVIVKTMYGTEGNFLQQDKREEPAPDYWLPCVVDFREQVETYYCKDCHLQYYVMENN